MIGIDGHTSEDASDCFCIPVSKALPINWCKKKRVALKVPEQWESKFCYSSYLKSVKAIAAPESLFDEEPTHGFKKGMYVEAVDVVEPHLICPGIGRSRFAKLQQFDLLFTLFLFLVQKSNRWPVI